MPGRRVTARAESRRRSLLKLLSFSTETVGDTGDSMSTDIRETSIRINKWKGRIVKIVVLMKQVPDTYEERKLEPITGLLDRDSSESVPDEVNERALEVALAFKDSNKGTEVVVVSAGPEDARQALRKGLQMGADSAVHVLDSSLAGADAVQTAAVLAGALKDIGFDLIIAGNESTDGRGGVVPAMISELLSVPMLGSLNEVRISKDSVSGVRREDEGSSQVRASLPALVSVTEHVAEARFPNFKGILTAKRKPLAQLSVADLEVDAAAAAITRSKILSTAERPARAVGVKIFDEGDAGVKLAEFLAAGRLI